MNIIAEIRSIVWDCSEVKGDKMVKNAFLRTSRENMQMRWTEKSVGEG